MSGHSKWANIKNRKGAQDKKRSEVFTKAAKNIMTAIRMGGGNTNEESNGYLREAVEKARQADMPKENIERLLRRFEERKGKVQAAMFEGFGPLGVPMMIEVETDNKNRTLSEIRLIFRNYNSSLAEEGAVRFLFDRVGEVEFLRQAGDEEIQLALIDKGAIDFEGEVVVTEPDKMMVVVETINKMGGKVVRSEIVMRSKQPVMVENKDDWDKVVEMIEELEDNDDVINVFAGFDYHE